MCSVCPAGYFGKFCSHICPSGTFGPKCGGKCAPECTNEKCDHVKGCQRTTNYISSVTTSGMIKDNVKMMFASIFINKKVNCILTLINKYVSRMIVILICLKKNAVFQILKIWIQCKMIRKKKVHVYSSKI